MGVGTVNAVLVCSGITISLVAIFFVLHFKT
jgi:hypothetical protein